MADMHTCLCKGVVFVGHDPEKFREMGRAKQSPIPHYIKFIVSYFRTFVIKMFSFRRFIKLTNRGKLQNTVTNSPMPITLSVFPYIHVG
jgi:hypothetical protein